MTQQELLDNFNIYCDNKDCNRICPEDKYIKCFAGYVIESYEITNKENKEEQ